MNTFMNFLTNVQAYGTINDPYTISSRSISNARTYGSSKALCVMFKENSSDNRR